MGKSKNPEPKTPSPSQSMTSPSQSNTIALSSGQDEPMPTSSTPRTRSQKKRVSDLKLHPERGFIMKDLPSEMRAMMARLCWESFMKHPQNPPVTVAVREFYAGISIQEGEPADYSVLRKKLVSFDADTINQHFGLKYRGGSFERALKGATKKEMESLKGRVAKPGVGWVKGRGGEFKLKRTDLIDEAKFWCFLICYKLKPSTHVTYIDKERLVLLDLILRGEKVNVGAIIEKEIKECFKKRGGCLFFPCLITELCLEAGVPIKDDEEKWPMIKAIDAQTLDRCRSVLQQQQLKPAAEKSAAAPAVATDNASGTLAEKLEEHRLKARFFWQYMMEFTKWQVAITDKSLVKNNPPPEFPEWILDFVKMAPQQAPPAAGPSLKRKREVSPSAKGKEKMPDPSSESSEEEGDDGSSSSVHTETSLSHLKASPPAVTETPVKGSTVDPMEVDKEVEAGAAGVTRDLNEVPVDEEKDEEKEEKKKEEKDAEPNAPPEPPIAAAQPVAAASSEPATASARPKRFGKKALAHKPKSPVWVALLNKKAKEQAELKQGLSGKKV